MSFYVTLPSNATDKKSEYGKKNNEMNDFETELKTPLDFSYQNYEVGLSEFSYILHLKIFHIGFVTIYFLKFPKLKLKTLDL